MGRKDIVQCAYSAPTSKPTTLLHVGVGLTDIQRKLRAQREMVEVAFDGGMEVGVTPPS